MHYFLAEALKASCVVCHVSSHTVVFIRKLGVRVKPFISLGPWQNT